ncbi:PilZ domain-containing protein [Kaarinaea lacus]
MFYSLYKKLIGLLLVTNNNRTKGLQLSQTEHTDQYDERRWAKRSLVTLRVNLYRNGELLRHTLATDCSLNGLFLRGHQVDLQVGDELSLAIPNNQDGTEKWYPMQVKVARIGKNGVGMLFHHHDPQLFCSVNKLLHACSEQLHSGQHSHAFSNTHEAA